jgi:DNA-binding NarL/FixJ family response regulator
MSKINIVVAEDHAMFRQAIVSELKFFNITTLAQVENGTELIKALSHNQPDIILLDIDMPGMDGEEALEIISQEYPNIKVIMVSLYNEGRIIIDFLEAGACAFIPKDLGIETLVEAIQKVKDFGYYYDNIPEAVMSAKLTSANKKNKLTKRQTQILPMICQGKTNKQIADELNVVVKTVEAHRAIIYRKTNSTSAVELLRHAQKHRIIKE